MMICLQELRKINFMVHNICRITKYSLTFAILQEYLENSNNGNVLIVKWKLVFEIVIIDKSHNL